MTRRTVAVCVLGIGCLSTPAFAQQAGATAAASAQGGRVPAPSSNIGTPNWRGWIDVSIGASSSAGGSFAETVTGPLVTNGVLERENSTFTSTYNASSGLAYDLGGGYLFTPSLGVGINISRSSHTDNAQLSVTEPSPVFLNTFATATGTSADLDRSDFGLHLSATWVVPVRGRFSARLFAGPSYFHATQDVVTNISTTRTFSSTTPTNSVVITGSTTGEVSDSGWGFNVGGDGSYFFTRDVGVGVLLRYARAGISLPNQFGTNPTGTMDTTAGGFQTVGGIRFRF